jgi:hypothetical protein
MAPFWREVVPPSRVMTQQLARSALITCQRNQLLREKHRLFEATRPFATESSAVICALTNILARFSSFPTVPGPA